LHFLQEIPGGKKTKFEEHKKWMGKGNKWLEKLNILGWEKASAWRAVVRGVPHLAVLLITDQLRHNPRNLTRSVGWDLWQVYHFRKPLFQCWQFVGLTWERKG
jgi:hypothetical protein